jgi:hypothetical protein
MTFTRAFSMPNAETFSMPPVEAFVRRYLAASKCSVDPFARNKRWATVTNDLSPDTVAEYHMDAEAFLLEMKAQGKMFDLALFDPPYSPRQISECYRGIGMEVGMKETQNAALYRRVRDALTPVLTPNAIVLSFGWNSNGMGKRRGWEITETLLVAHGGGHNDTICIAERRVVRNDLLTALEAA